jgi:putative transposase
MPSGLRRYQQTRGLHFLTFSCYRRLPFLASPRARDLFERALEHARVRYGFYVAGYVVMPEHVHLLMTEPERANLATAVQAIKQSVSRKLIAGREHFWQARYYDFNVFTSKKRIEKLKYIHRNPVKRGLVDRPEDWAWSSLRHYVTGESGAVGIESPWTKYYRTTKGPVLAKTGLERGTLVS